METRQQDTHQSSRRYQKRSLATTTQRDLVVASLLRCPDVRAGEADRRKRPS